MNQCPGHRAVQDPSKPISEGAVAQMARYIANHRAQTMLVMEAADAAGLHPGFATTIFRRTLGLTINKYVVRQRPMVAQMLLVAN
jgi:AraC family transcriptional regulator, melibiose operon regulatory protein